VTYTSLVIRRVALLAAFAAALVVPAASLAAPSEDVPPDAIATVAGEPIPRAAFDDLMAQARRAYKQQKRTFPKMGTPAWRRLKDQAVALLVQRTEFRQKAAELGIVVSDADVDARLAQIVKDYFGGSNARLQKQIAKQGLTLAEVRDSIREQLVSERLFQQVTASVTVSDEDVAAYYAAHVSQFTRPQSRDVRHIMVKTKAEADALYARLKAGEGFAALARKYSKDPGSAANGGRLTISRGSTVKSFDQVAFALRTGAISRPFKTAYGWHIVQALSPIRPAHHVPLEKVRDAIGEELLQTRRNAAMQKWTADLKAYYADKVVYAPGFAPGE
jgi:peptidyl-prolyl cis-trans isomerase C